VAQLSLVVRSILLPPFLRVLWVFWVGRVLAFGDCCGVALLAVGGGTRRGLLAGGGFRAGRVWGVVLGVLAGCC